MIRETLYTPSVGRNAKPQVKDLSTSWDELVSIEEVQRWVQQHDTSEKQTLNDLRIAAIRLLERSYNVTLSVRNRTAYYEYYGVKVPLWFGPHDTIDQVRIDGTITTEFREYGFEKKILYFDYSGEHLEIDFKAGSNSDDLKKAVLMQVKFMYDGEWDREEMVSPEVDKILNNYAPIY